MDSPIVATRGLTKRYGSVIGVIDLDLELVAGEIFGFIGPNGAGKTTTIRLLLDLIRPTAGRATVFGLDSRRSAIEIRSRVGYLPGQLTLFDRLTAVELFDWLGRFRPGYERAHALDLARRLSLDPGRPIGELSTGNRQKVGLVQAFMHRPDLLILDEPTAGLDPLVRRQFRALLAETRAAGGTVLLSSHVLAEVEEDCDRVGTIVEGRLRSVDSVDELRARSRRRVRVVIEGPAPVDALRGIDGVGGVVAEQRPGDGLTAIDLDITGPTDPLIKQLAGCRVVDLLSRPMSLEEVFLEEYVTPDGGGRPVPSGVGSGR